MGRRAPALRRARVLEARGRGGSSRACAEVLAVELSGLGPAAAAAPAGAVTAPGPASGRLRTSRSVRASQSARLRPFAPRRLASVYENSTWLHNRSRDLTPESGLCLPHPDRRPSLTATRRDPSSDRGREAALGLGEGAPQRHPTQVTHLSALTGSRR